MWQTCTNAIVAAVVATSTLACPASADSGHIYGPTGYPLPPAWMVREAVSRYLVPCGFDGEAVAIWTPENGEIAGLYEGADIVVDTTKKWTDEHPGETLWVFGYSQSASIISLVMPKLAAAGIPSDALHFVLVGDPALPTGMLSNMVDSFPDGLRATAESIAIQLGYGELMGLTGGKPVVTPTDLYPVDVFTITGDGYANWSWDHLAGLIFDHQLYLGVNPDQWGEPVVTGMLREHTVDLSGQPSWDALWTVLGIALKG